VKDLLNSVNNDLLIKIGNNWDFFFLEEDEFISSPVNSYYFLAQDLSINMFLSLKWARYGWFFFKSLDESLNELDTYTSVNFGDSINYNPDTALEDRILLVDGDRVDSFDLFKEKFENDYNSVLFSLNSVIHLKLKLNVHEYIIIHDDLFPKLGEFE
jgi:hypothetical protein